MSSRYQTWSEQTHSQDSVHIALMPIQPTCNSGLYTLLTLLSRSQLSSRSHSSFPSSSISFPCNCCSSQEGQACMSLATTLPKTACYLYLVFAIVQRTRRDVCIITQLMADILQASVAFSRHHLQVVCVNYSVAFTSACTAAR